LLKPLIISTYISISLLSGIIYGQKTNQQKRSAIIQEAKKHIGVTYIMGGTTPAGFDCSGYTLYVYNKIGYKLKRSSFDQFSSMTPIKEPSKGDLVFFQTYKAGASHVGIYTGNGKFLHAPQTGSRIKYGDMNKNYWKIKYLGARTVFNGSSNGKIPIKKGNFAGRLSFSSRFAFAPQKFITSNSNPDNIDALLAFDVGFSLHIPWRGLFSFLIQPQMETAVIENDNGTWLPLFFRIPVILAVYAIDSPEWALSLQAGVVPSFWLGYYNSDAGTMDVGKLTMDISLGFGIHISNFSLDVRYEYGLLRYIKTPGTTGHISRLSIGLNSAF